MIIHYDHESWHHAKNNHYGVDNKKFLLIELIKTHMHYLS